MAIAWIVSERYQPGWKMALVITGGLVILFTVFVAFVSYFPEDE